MSVIRVSDLVDPEDGQGRSYRQVNAEKKHNIPIGTLVELENGCRAWVVYHGRDCDQTPLYAVSLNRDDTEQKESRFMNHSWDHGWPEDSLTIVS